MKKVFQARSRGKRRKVIRHHLGSMVGTEREGKGHNDNELAMEMTSANDLGGKGIGLLIDTYYHEEVRRIGNSNDNMSSNSARGE